MLLDAEAIIDPLSVVWLRGLSDIIIPTCPRSSRFLVPVFVSCSARIPQSTGWLVKSLFIKAWRNGVFHRAGSLPWSMIAENKTESAVQCHTQDVYFLWSYISCLIRTCKHYEPQLLPWRVTGLTVSSLCSSTRLSYDCSCRCLLLQVGHVCVA